MDDLTEQGVLSHLMALERGGGGGGRRGGGDGGGDGGGRGGGGDGGGRGGGGDGGGDGGGRGGDGGGDGGGDADASQQDQHQSERLEMLKVKAVTLRNKRDELKRQINGIKFLKEKIKKDLPLDDDANGSVELHRSLLTAWQMQLKDLQRAHHLIGGYDVVQCKEGRSVCVSFHTGFEGVYLDTYNMELDLTRTVHISRHNIPPVIPLERLAKQNLQKDLKAFLQTLSQHLNALAARRQQISLIKELVGSVEVMESNQLCSNLVLMCKTQGETSVFVLCTLEYRDLIHHLPTHVSIESEDKTLSESEQWKKNRMLFLESPAHTALLTMKRMGSIV